jgi:hypothetical protein
MDRLPGPHLKILRRLFLMSETEVRAQVFAYYVRFLIIGTLGTVVFFFCRDDQYIPQYVLGYVLIGCVGAIVSLAYGKFTWKAREKYKKDIQVTPERATEWPVWIGIIERLIYTTLVGFDISGAAAFIGAWVTIKAIGGWASWSQDKDLYGKVLFFSALLGSAISVLFGLIGGIVILKW